MTATFPSSLLLHAFLLHLLLARLATSTLMTPSLPNALTCLPATTPNKPTALDCTAAMLGMPRSQQGVDYHVEPAASGPRRVIYDTALTSVGPADAPYHLPRTWDFDSCRVTVRMADGVHLARVLWMDVQQSTLELIHTCVGDLMVTTPGPGAGGTTSIGAVIIGVEYVGPAAGPGKPNGDGLIGTGPVTGSAPGSRSRIEAY